MADITDPGVVLAVEQRFRIRAETIRDLLDLLQDDHLEYWQTISGILGSHDPADEVDDQNRAHKPVTKADIVTFKAREDALLAVLEAASAMDVVQRFVIRPPKG